MSSNENTPFGGTSGGFKAPPIPGYQDVSAAQKDLVWINKQSEERLLRVIDEMQRREGPDQRWLSVARTHFEQGYMALNRAIFKPHRISLPDDHTGTMQGSGTEAKITNG